MNVLELDHRLASELESRTPYVAIDAMCEHASAQYLVWWGCLCSWSTWRPVPPSNEDQSLSIVSRWILTGDEKLREKAAIRAESPEAGTCKWLLNAMVNSGGTVAASGHATATTPPDVAGRFVLGFIHQLLATRSTIERTTAAQTFVQLARQTLAEPLPRATASLGSIANHE